MAKRALESFAVPGFRMVHAGDILADDDPILKGRGHLFEDLSEYVTRTTSQVEQATAAPGEKRSLGKRGRKPKKHDTEPVTEEGEGEK